MASARDLEGLHAFIDGRQMVPYAWGREANDCVGYVLEAVAAQTGVAVVPEAIWTSRAQALRLIKLHGGIKAAFDAHFQRVAPALASRGDIAGVDDAEFGLHPMIVEGATLVGPGENGNRRLPRSAMTMAWSASLLVDRADVPAQSSLPGRAASMPLISVR